MFRVLVAEDEAHNRDAMRELLTKLGCEVSCARDGREALELGSTREFDLVFSDVRMPELDGLQMFSSLRAIHSARGARTPPVVFMTAYGRLEEAVDAMRDGALHFLSKPIRKKDLQQILDEVAKLALVPAGEGELEELVAESRKFREIVQTVDRVAATMAPVLFTGESGTGKEVLARRLHARSARASGPLVAVHVGAVPETLFESELFGFEKGAFTGADQARLGRIREADGGSFFLDEVSTMPPASQVKLLRVIQDRLVLPLGGRVPVSVDVRWIAATNDRLEDLVASGAFREDLFHRLSVIVIEVPSLRERTEDVMPLAGFFLSRFRERDGRQVEGFTAEAAAKLVAYAWPGNVRELRNVVERAVALSSPHDRLLGLELLPPHISQESKAAEIRVLLGTSLASVEDRMIEETLRHCGNDKNQAAHILGVAPRTIYRWLERRKLP